MFEALISLLEDVGFREVIRGLPDTLETDTVAYVLMGPRELIDRSGLVDRVVTFYVYTGYRVESREAEAELRVMDQIDALEEAWLVARKPDGVWRSSVIDMTIAANPEYRDFTEQEYRLYPLSFRMVERFNRP
jgi:hypothetical protein